MRNLEWNMNDALQARFDEGRNEEREFIALNMLRSGMTEEKIQEFTKLSMERIKELTKNIDN